jgi:hypothetical protein
MTVVVAVVRRSSQSLTLNLSSSLGQHGNVTAAVVVNRRNRQGKGRVGVRRRHIRWSQCRARRGPDGLGRGRRRHHPIGHHVRRKALLLVHLVLLLLVCLGRLVTSPWVRVVVNARVACELIRSRELLAAAGELAGVRLLSSVSADVSSLMLEAVEGLIAERTLVRSGQLIWVLRVLDTRKGAIGLDNGNCCCSHLDVALMGFFRFLISRNCGVK